MLNVSSDNHLTGKVTQFMQDFDFFKFVADLPVDIYPSNWTINFDQTTLVID